jgi:very-short-patch-repair endonuclease
LSDLPDPLVQAELRARFRRIREHYRRHHAAIMADGSEWFDDAYSWDHEAGIRLTPIENALWYDIRAESLVLYPQYPVGRFFVDFGNPVDRVAIECDGERWHTDRERDAARQVEIQSMGWAVYRISGTDCFGDFIEGEDEIGRPFIKAGAARCFVREIAVKHPTLRRARNGGVLAAKGLVKWFDAWEEAAKDTGR